MFIKLCKDIVKGRTLVRAMMNQEMINHELSGKVLDLGGGKNSENSYCFQKNNNLILINLDGDAQDVNARINFETDKLPFNDEELDQIVMLNILEHIYNYKFLMHEVRRVISSRGKIVGFVPFLVNYHPHPHDYFRYTDESLKKIFSEAGFNGIEINRIGRGPFAVNFNNIALSIPKLLRIIVFPGYYLLDSFFIKLRPNTKTRFPLGYSFVLRP